MATLKLTKPGTKAHATRMEKIAIELRKYLLEREMWQDTAIYFNGKRFDSYPVYEDGKNVNYNNPAHLHVVEDVNPKSFCEYGNENTITVTFEGGLYDALNHGSGKTDEDLNAIFGKYGYYFEQGYAWSLSLYEN
jgi:hypothetical protein